MTYKLPKVYKPTISGQKAPGQKATTYTLLRCQTKQTHHQWTECHRTMTYILSRCQRKQTHISGQNVSGQEPTTYTLLRCQIKQTHQWTECLRTRANNLHPVEVPNKANPPSVDRMSQDRNQQLTSCQGARESKPTISGQDVSGQEPTTYKLLRCQIKQTHHQWTECPRTRTNNLHSVEVPNKANPPSVDRMSQDRNQQLTCC